MSELTPLESLRLVTEKIKDYVDNKSIDTDTSLSLSGYAADSKTVGDELRRINTKIICLTDSEIEAAWTGKESQQAAVLDENGLKYLIGKIQSKIIRSESYSNVRALGDDSTSGSIAFFKVHKTENAHWIVKYRVTVELENVSNSTQVADVVVGGVGDTVAYYTSSNIIYDTDHNSAKNTVVVLNSGSSPNYIGLDISNTYSQNHSLKVDLQYAGNCSCEFLTTASVLYIDHTLKELKLINFRDNGTFSDFRHSQYVQRDELADVAFSGDYDDLKNKLDMYMDGERLVYAKD